MEDDEVNRDGCDWSAVISLVTDAACDAKSNLPEVPFQGRKVQSAQNCQVHNESHEKPHRGESSDSVDDVYFEMPPKGLVDHLTK